MNLIRVTQKYWIFSKWGVLISVSKARFPKFAQALQRAYEKGRNGFAFSRA
jgi:hypothetical protein